MPIGCSSAIPHLAQALHESNPSRVLDLGIGFGFNGACVRQWLDLGVEPYRVHLTGVEVFSKYRSPLWALYHKVHEKEIIQFLDKTTERWPFSIMTDVLEHFTEKQGHECLEMLKERADQIFIGTPGIWVPQGTAHGNNYEQHKSLWTAQQLHNHGFRVIDPGTEPDRHGNYCLMALWTR